MADVVLIKLHRCAPHPPSKSPMQGAHFRIATPESYMTHDLEKPRFLIAVDPDTSTIQAKWDICRGYSADRVAQLMSALQRMVGDEYVILDTKDYESWLPGALSAGDGVWPRSVPEVGIKKANRAILFPRLRFIGRKKVRESV